MEQYYTLQKSGQDIDTLLAKIDALGPATTTAAGTMSAADKIKLDDIEAEAEENVIDEIKLGGTALTVQDKAVNIPVDSVPASGSSNPVSSGGVYSAIRTVESDVSYIESKISPEAEPNDKLLAASEISRAIATALANYYTKNQTYSQEEVNALVAAIKQFTVEVINELPTASADTMNIIYLVPSSNPKTQNAKDEYITIRSGSVGSYTYAWEQIGTTAIDISGKADKDADAVAGNIAKFDSNGNPVDAGIAAESVAQKADKVSGATNNNLASLDSNGNLKDSGYKPSDFATDAQGAKADSAVQPSDLEDYTREVANLPKNYISTESLVALLDALKTAGVITTYTMTWNASLEKYQFVITH